MLRSSLITMALIAQTSASSAFEITLPEAATLLSQNGVAMDGYALPTGPFANGVLPTRALEGHISRQSWRIDAQAQTSLQIMAPIRDQLIAMGYETELECDAPACGGFDFRFETEVLPAPDMHVDLSDFRFFSATRGSEDHVSLLVSRSANAGFVQLFRITKAEESAPVLTGQPAQSANTPLGALLGQGQSVPTEFADLVTVGHIVLDDLTFNTGSSDLGPGPYASLENLARFLNGDSTRLIALVGHTDAVGDLDRNIALSKRRAASVLERLVSSHNVSRAQLRAEGMGFLSPIAANLTDIGRDANRRVEAVLLNIE